MINGLSFGIYWIYLRESKFLEKDILSDNYEVSQVPSCSLIILICILKKVWFYELVYLQEETEGKGELENRTKCITFSNSEYKPRKSKT